MTRSERGGLSLKTGKIGRANCIRQQIMMPGERMNIRLNGKVRLEALRERDVLRINAHLGVFMTPLRWLWTDFPQYLREGPDTAVTPPTVSSEGNWSNLGIGSYTAGALGSYYKWYQDAYNRVVNEWYKWPEDSDVSGHPPNDGHKAVPLAKPWTRCRYDATPDDTGDYTIDVSGATMDVRSLAEIQARFRSAMKRDVLSYNRWMEIIKDVYKGNGSREVDQVPILLDQVEVGVNPREIPATDGASLGQWQSLFDFGVDHQIRGVVAPEHCILTYVLTVRFSATVESVHPLATDRLDWHEMVADPEFLAAAMPRQVQKRDVFQSNSSTEFGYLPAGWQWRCDHDVIGKRVDERDSFPMMEIPSTKEECKDATRTVDAFRSQALGDYLVDIFVSEDSIQPIGDAMDSYMSGMVDDTNPRVGKRNVEFPHGGKQL